MIAETKKPIYDEKVNTILQQLHLGKSREKLAEESGYTTYKSIDMYMRRKNFKWDSRAQNYIPDFGVVNGNLSDEAIIPTSKAYTVVSLFEKNKPNADPLAIARLAGFRDHLEMAMYMKSKNYIWDNISQNYINDYGKNGLAEQPIVLEKKEINNLIESEPLPAVSNEHFSTTSSSNNLDRFLPLLEMLEKYKTGLLDAIMIDKESSTIPRYIIPGVYITKSVHMANNMDRLLREFSREKNISQRDIFEIALIHFFRQYGYRKEIDAILNK